MSGAVEGVALPIADQAREVLATVLERHQLNSSAYYVRDSQGIKLTAVIAMEAMLEFASLTTPPARSYADEDVARIIAPDQWRAREGDIARGEEWHRKADRYAVEADPNLFPLGQQAIDRTVEAWRGLADRFITGADDRVKDSLTKAAAIRLLSQGEKA